MKQETAIPDNLFIVHGKEIEAILRRAAKNAVFIHKKLGNSVVCWRDSKVTIIPPEEIEIDENDPDLDYELAKESFILVHGEKARKRLEELEAMEQRASTTNADDSASLGPPQ